MGSYQTYLPLQLGVNHFREPETSQEGLKTKLQRRLYRVQLWLRSVETLTLNLQEYHETVMAHRNLAAHARKREMLMGGKLKQVNSGEFQGAVLRPRAIMTNITDFDQSPELEGLHMAPSILLKDGYQPSQVPLQCLMCSNRTHNPATLSKRSRGEVVDRFPDVNERDCLITTAAISATVPQLQRHCISSAASPALLQLTIAAAAPSVFLQLTTAAAPSVLPELTTAALAAHRCRSICTPAAHHRRCCSFCIPAAHHLLLSQSALLQLTTCTNAAASPAASLLLTPPPPFRQSCCLYSSLLPPSHCCSSHRSCLLPSSSPLLLPPAAVPLYLLCCCHLPQNHCLLLAAAPQLQLHCNFSTAATFSVAVTCSVTVFSLLLLPSCSSTVTSPLLPPSLSHPQRPVLLPPPRSCTSSIR